MVHLSTMAATIFGCRLLALCGALLTLAGAEETCDWPPGDSRTGATSPYIELTADLEPSTVAWDSTKGIGHIRELISDQENGDPATVSLLRQLPVHTATHVDAPCHWIVEECRKGLGVESLSLQALNGPALVVQTPSHSNITGKVLSGLPIPPGTRRLLFRSSNTDKRLMHKTQFDSSYTAVTKDGAQWLVDHLPSLQLVGIDYTSIAVYSDLPGAHHVLLPRHIVIIEGLVLDELQPGLHTLHCLPLKLKGFDGSPVRCIAS